MTDFRIADHGSVVIVTPVSAAAKDYSADVFSEDTPRWGGGYAVEPRYADDLVSVLQRDGFEVSS